MDAPTQIKRMHDFIEAKYYAALLDQIRKGEKYLNVQFSDLSEFDPEVADNLLETPEDILKAGEIAIEQFDVQGDNRGFSVRFFDLPSAAKLMIRNIRSKHLHSFMYFDGTVRQKSDVRPQVTSSKFECPSCGNIISVLQLDTNLKEPTKCGCGRKGKFRLIHKELVDAQKLVLEESSEDLDGGEQPKRLTVFLKNDLVSPISDKKTNPGSKIAVVGILKEVPIFNRAGVQSTRFDIMLEGNSIQAKEEEFLQLSISEEELERIKILGQDPQLMGKLRGSIAPSIYGHNEIKEALLLQLVGGCRKKRNDGVVTRGDIHVLLVGDPGSGKSMLLKRINVAAPKAKFISGKGVSGAGLTATVVKDDFLGGWSLEAGALVLANRGVCCIDELDKMSPDDTSAMHEALEGQTVTISKANIQATLRCETTVLAAANPKFGRFDPYGTIAEQLDLPSTLINRFDLIFPIKDLPDITKDERLANFVLELHRTGQPKGQEPEVEDKLLRKYIAYSKREFDPRLSLDAVEEIKDYYLKMRSSGKTESGIKSIPISARQLEGLIRLAEASAKIHLRNNVTREDALRAIELLNFCLRQIAFDEETGTIDIDRIAGEIPASKRNKIIAIKEIIDELEREIGKTIPVEDIIQAATQRGLERSIVDEVLEKLKREGDVFEPRKGFLSKIG
jgi:replicative DNA helicase Mcm